MDQPRMAGQLVHCEGISQVCIDSKRQIISVGRDCNVIFYDKDIEGDPYQFETDGIDSVQSIACYCLGGKSCVAIATNENSVVGYSYLPGNPNDDPQANAELQGLLLRFTASVNFVDVSYDGKQLAAGSSDFLVKVVELSDTSLVTTLSGHEAPVLCVRFDPLGHLLASSSCDGSVRVWSLKDKTSVVTLPVLKKCNDICLAPCLCRLSWKPGNGMVLAVPTGQDVKLYERDSWKNMRAISDQSHKQVVNVVAWSSCGTYFAVGGADGHVTVWAYPSFKLLHKRATDEGSITSMVWDPIGTKAEFPLIFATVMGRLAALPREWACPTEGDHSEINGPDDLYSDPLAEDSLLMEGIPADDIFNDDGLSNLVGAGSNHELAVSDSKAEEDPDEHIVVVRKRKRVDPEPSDDSEGGEGDERDDDAASSCSPSTSPWKQDSHINRTTESRPVEVIQKFSEKDVEGYQDPFQPGSTPSHLRHHFMVFNMIGMVRSHTDNTNTSMVEVEFHDTATYHTFTVPNILGFSMAALSSTTLGLACERIEEEPSQLQVNHFSSWDNSREWTVRMPGKENIECMAVGDNWVAVATNRRHLRLFTSSGIQREVLSLPGAVVTMSGRIEKLAIVYQTPPCTENVFTLMLWVLDVHCRRELHPARPLPLSAHAHLEWIGFSEEGLVLTYDTKGIVRVLTSHYGLSWQPVADCTKQLGNRGDHYFLVGMTHAPQELRVVLCKGLDYPPIYPRPVMSTLPLRLPLCEPQTEKTDMEDQYLQHCLLRPPSVQPTNSVLIKYLVQLFALACHSGRESQAYEVANMMPSEQGLQLAFQYASKSGHVRLAHEISEVIEHRTPYYTDSEDQTDEEEVTPSDHTCDYPVSNHKQHNQLHNGSHGNGLAKPRSFLQTNDRPKVSLQKTSTQRVSKYSIGSAPAQGVKEKTPEVSDQEDEDACADEEKMDQTEELFSDPDKSGDERIGSKRIASSPVANQSLELGFTTPTSVKRSNPFRMTTPVSKKIQVERRSSFLDNICAEAKEEEEKKRKKKKQKTSEQLPLPFSKGGQQKERSITAKKTRVKKPQASDNSLTGTESKSSASQKLSAFAFAKSKKS